MSMAFFIFLSLTNFSIDLGKTSELPGYLNRFDGASKAWSGSDGEFKKHQSKGIGGIRTSFGLLTIQKLVNLLN